MVSISIAILSLFLFTLSGYAGRLFITGHDPDFHATRGRNQTGARNILKIAINYVLNGSTKPVLLLQTRTTPVSDQHALADEGLIAAGIRPCPQTSPCFTKLNVTQFRTANLADFGAIFIPSDFGGTLTQAELNAVNDRAADIIAFINAGGGLVALAESGAGDSDITQGFYRFLPFLISAPPRTAFETGFKIQPFGIGLGLTDTDVNGNFYHNIFVDGAGLQIVDRAQDNSIVSIAFQGQIINGQPVPDGGGPTPPPPPPGPPPSQVPELSSPLWFGLLSALFVVLLFRELRRRARAE